MTDLAKKKCIKCGGISRQVVAYQESPPARKGWYCHECRHFDKAIGRERKVER